MSFRKTDALFLAGAIFITRFAFRSHYLYDLDSVNFALGMERFDPRVHQAHPPGYFLYICLGRLLNLVFHDANLALVMLSIVASCGAVVFIYYLALEWFDRTTARFGGALFLLSPLAWFHGTVALTYSVEAFFSALLGYLCWRAYSGSKGFIVLAALTLGISAGVRPSSCLFLGPLFLFSLFSLGKAKWKWTFAGISALVLAVAAWFVPMLVAAGGAKAYFGALFSLWQSVPSKDTLFNSSPLTSVARALTIVFIYFLSFGLISLLPLLRLRGVTPVERRKKIFTAVWVVPALCFFTFVFLRFVNSGYLLLLAPAACIWLGYLVSKWYESTQGSKASKAALLAFCVIVDVTIFIAAPLYCSYISVRRFEGELQSVLTALPQVAPASNTLIVGFDSHFLGYRHAGYYLPDYLTLESPEIRLREGTRIFAMQGRDTRLLASLPATSCSQFVFFPLPNHGSDYKEHLKKATGQLPSGSLRTVSAGGHDFVIGPISDLPLLFPHTAEASKTGRE